MDHSNCLAGPCEPLDKHLWEVALCVSQKSHFVALKLAAVFKQDAREVKDLLFFGALLHDVGKADKRYVNSTGFFPLHEALSTTFVVHVFRDANIPHDCKLTQFTLSNAILAAIALHHYSSKKYHNYSIPTSNLEPRCKNHLEAIKRWLPLSPLGDSLKQVALNASNFPASECHRIILETTSRPIINKKLLQAISAILGIYGECDNEIAGKNRCNDV
jgi:CRISPR/Cas system-associated endonuclease Cas3-HD